MSEPYWVPLSGADAAPPPAGAMTRIFDSTLGAAAANFTISSIPGTYSHLLLMGLLRSDAGGSWGDMRLQFNGDTGANYDRESVSAVSSVQGASEAMGQTAILIDNGVVHGGAPVGRFGPLRIDIPHYASTVASKGLTGQAGQPAGSGGGGFRILTFVGEWRPAVIAAITSILIAPASGNFVAGSRLSLYGIT